MRRKALLFLIMMGLILIPVSQFVIAQSTPPAGAKSSICHITDASAGTGHVISIANNSAALNAHEAMHGDCDDWDGDEESCECEVSTEPIDDEDEDDGGDDDEDDGPDDDEDDE